MPLALHLPTGHRAGGSRRASRLRLWLAAQHAEHRRARRFLLDHRHLLEMDARLLGDVGLTREDVLRGVPFRCDAPGICRSE